MLPHAGRARMARIDVPQPMSSTDLPLSVVSSNSPMMRLVVSWCPVPKAIWGLITMSYSTCGTSWLKGAVNNTAVANDDGLEEILFPLLVPILILRFYVRVSDVCVGYREFGNGFLNGWFIAQLLAVCRQSARCRLSQNFQNRLRPIRLPARRSLFPNKDGC